ncbi:hypothetical protein GQ457_06G026250 [Hibiscus cannabinus]
MAISMLSHIDTMVKGDWLVSFSFVGRNGNISADNLAKLAWQLPYGYTRFLEPLDTVPAAINHDIYSIRLLIKADDEPVDPKKYLEDGCKPKCVKQLRSYEACIKRIQGDESGHKHCTGQYFDYWSCVDKCVAPTLFPKLK